jgi:hypothetical protein
METFLKFLREALKGIVREFATHVFRKNVLKQINRPTLSQAKGWFSNTK